MRRPAWERRLPAGRQGLARRRRSQDALPHEHDLTSTYLRTAVGTTRRAEAMADVGATTLSNTVREAAHPLAGAAHDYDPLVELVGDARFVLIGEASYGTHEFYHERAQITKRLITEKGFTAVAVEADWPDAYRVNCYVRGASGDADASDALAASGRSPIRFPTWMWRNTVVHAFVEWLRAHNEALPSDAPKAGFY